MMTLIRNPHTLKKHDSHQAEGWISCFKVENYYAVTILKHLKRLKPFCWQIEFVILSTFFKNFMKMKGRMKQVLKHTAILKLRNPG